MDISIFHLGVLLLASGVSAWAVLRKPLELEPELVPVPVKHQP